MARLSMVCRLEGDRAWSRAVAGFEQRLLDNLDALLALGRSDLDPRDALPFPTQVDEPHLDRIEEPEPTYVEGERLPTWIDWSQISIDPPRPSADWPELDSQPPAQTEGSAPSGVDEPTSSQPSTSPPASAPALPAVEPEALELPRATDVVDALARYTREVPGDANRAFVRSFVLGCLAGEEAVRAAVTELRRAPRSTLPAHARALSLASNSAIDAAMGSLCHDDDPRLLALAMDVLRARSAVSFANVATAIAHPDARVRRSAARALAVAREHAAAAELLASQVESELDELTLAALAEALLQIDERRGLTAVRSRLTEEAEFSGTLPRRARLALLQLLALSGDGSDLEMILGLAERPAEIELLGWYGHAGAVPVLLDVLAEPAPPALHSAAETRPLAAARALQRITGAMSEDSAPRGVGYRPDAVLSDRDRWASWWTEHRERFAPGIKHRHGAPFAVDASLDELTRSGVPQDVRECAALELSLLSGGVPAPWLGDWSRRLEAALADWREHFRRFTRPTGAQLHTPGEWPARRLGERLRATQASRSDG